MTNNDQYNYCIVAGCTDVGCKRTANEDSMGWRDTTNGRVVAVCDGMGGHVGGATASRIAVDSILQFLDSQFFEDPREGLGMAIDYANRAIIQHADEHTELKGMGSTCTLLLIRNGLVYLAHVGDSRIYLVRNHLITQLTKDHSFVQMLVDAGQLTAEEAEHHPRKNEITNALGLPNMTPATIKEDAIMPEAGDSFLLCSDGLSGLVPDRQMEKVMSDHTIRAQQKAQMLINMARQNGGPDNITAQIVEFVVAPTATKKLPLTRQQLYWLIAAVAAIGLAVGLFFILRPGAEPTNENNIQSVDNQTAAVTNIDTAIANNVDTNTISPIAVAPTSPIIVYQTAPQKKNNTEEINLEIGYGESIRMKMINHLYRELIIGKYSKVFDDGFTYKCDAITFSSPTASDQMILEWINTSSIDAKVDLEIFANNDHILYHIQIKKGSESDIKNTQKENTLAEQKENLPADTAIQKVEESPKDTVQVPAPEQDEPAKKVNGDTVKSSKSGNKKETKSKK